MSLKMKFMIPLIVLTAIAASAVLVSNILSFSNYVDDNMSERVKQASELAQHEIDSLKIHAYTASSEISKDPNIINSILNSDHDALIRYSQDLLKESGMEFCTIGDASGTAIARPHKPEVFGDDITPMPSVKSALAGKSLTVIEEGTSVRMSICSGTTIYDSKNNIIGVVVVGFRLDTYTFVDVLKRYSGCEAAIFLNGESISTTVIKDDGERAIGITPNEKASAEVLTGKTTIYNGQEKILDREVAAQYTPVYGINDSILGMMFIGRYVTEKTETMQSFAINGVLIMAVIILISFGIAFLIAKWVSKDVEKLLNDIIGNIKQSIIKISSASNILTEVSENLSDGSLKQASAIQETSAAIHEATNIVTQTAENTQHVSQLALTSKETAISGKEKILEMVDLMNELKSSSNAIGSVIRIIDEIAFQTNLLAINATVEAARAGGDAGRSFSVVAEEVRRLAQQSATSVSNTSGIIEKNVSLTTMGTRSSHNAASIFEKITDEYERLNTLINEINAASQDQANGLSQINAAVTQIEELTEHNTALAEETAASSHQLQEETEMLQKIVESASKIVNIK